jgi:hypothetical protein
MYLGICELWEYSGSHIPTTASEEDVIEKVKFQFWYSTEFYLL